MATAKSPKSATNEKQGGANDFTLVSGFTNGYRNREDVTVLPPGVLVAGSQNVLTNTFERVGIRKGYTLDGDANTDAAPIGGQNGAMGVFEFLAAGSAGQEERHLRAGFLTSAGNDGKLQFRYVHTDGTVEWVDLLTGLTSIDFNFITFWDEDTLQTVCLMVNGESNIRAWNGQFTTVASATNTSGIIYTIAQPGDFSQILVSGGYGYTANDMLTVSGGDGTAQVQVLTITTGAISAVVINNAGTGYNVNDEVNISGGTGGLFTCICKVLAVGGGGAVTSLSILGNGKGYSSASGVATTNLVGTGVNLTVDTTVSGGAISDWEFISDADHGTTYASNTTYNLTGGTGHNAHIRTDSVVSGTITKSGAQTWAEAGFVFDPITGTGTLLINGTTYTYDTLTFIGDTTTLYGVTPDPSGLSVDDLIIQEVVTYPNLGGGSGLPTDFHNDLIGTISAAVFVGSKTSGFIYASAPNSFKTWNLAATTAFTTPPTAFIPQEDALYISTGSTQWYKISFIASADLMTVALKRELLNTASQQGAQSQAATSKTANSVVFLSFEPVIETFGPVTNIFLGPQMTDLSYPIVNDMNAYDLTNTAIAYHRKFIYVAVPAEGLVLMYNMTNVNNPYWEAPQVLPISRFSIIDGELYGHSSQVSETYKLFDGTNDNGYPVAASATFSFNNYGTRTTSKGYNEFFAEGYISPNCTLELGIQYDIDGCATKTFFDIVGNDSQIVCLLKDEASLGKVSLGKNPLGSQTITDPNALRPKFRVIKTFPTKYFYEDQISFGSEDIDVQWEIIGFGPQLLAFTDQNNALKQ